MTEEERKEKRRIANKKYYDKTKTKNNQKSKEWRVKNKEKVKEYNSNYYSENQEHIKLQTKKYRKQNIPKYNEYIKHKKNIIFYLN